MYKSPFAPPRVPGSPSPLKTIDWSLSIPAGILIFNLACFLTVPFPWQISQGFGISCKPPDEYSKRFGQFLIKIFEVSEADLLCSSKLDQENGIPKDMMSEDGGNGKSERRKSCFSSKVMFSEEQSEKK